MMSLQALSYFNFIKHLPLRELEEVALNVNNYIEEKLQWYIKQFIKGFNKRFKKNLKSNKFLLNVNK